MARNPLAAAVVLFSALTLAGCSGSSNPMGPEAPEPPEEAPAPGPASQVEMEGPSSDSLTLEALTDTVQLSVRAYDKQGREIPDPEVEWASNNTEVFRVTDDGGVYLRPTEENTYSTSADRDEVPASPDPQSAVIAAMVDGVQTSREFVQTSPVSWVNVSPDGACILAPGQYSDPKSSRSFTQENPVLDGAKVDARDYWGRVEPVEGVNWQSSDPSIATVEPDPAEATKARIEITHAGQVEITATLAGITDTYPIESSDAFEWNYEPGKGDGSVECSTGPSTG